MFNVTLLHLTRDLRVAEPDLGRDELGEVEREQLLVLLETFRNIDPVQNHDAAPRVLIRTAAGDVSIRTEKGRLFLDAPIASATAADGYEPDTLIEAIAASPSPPPPRPRKPALSGRTLLGLAIFAASAALDWNTLRTALAYPSVEETVSLRPFDDARELAAVNSAVKGRYSTGDDPGDRIIEIQNDGTVRFFRRIAQGERLENEDRFRIARNAAGVALATAHSGVITVTNIDVIAYSGDVYRRK